MSEVLGLGALLVGLFVLGHIINAVSESAYWAFIDWKNRKNKE